MRAARSRAARHGDVRDAIAIVIHQRKLYYSHALANIAPTLHVRV